MRLFLRYLKEQFSKHKFDILLLSWIGSVIGLVIAGVIGFLATLSFFFLLFVVAGLLLFFVPVTILWLADQVASLKKNYAKWKAEQK